MKQINLILPAQAAKMGGDLGAILGQHGVNIMKFCKEFNDLTTNYEYNMQIRTILTLEDNNNFSIKPKGPVLSFLIKSFGNDKKEIKFLDIYKIIKVKKKVDQVFEEKILLKSILSTIKSMRFKVIYE